MAARRAGSGVALCVVSAAFVTEQAVLMHFTACSPFGWQAECQPLNGDWLDGLISVGIWRVSFFAALGAQTCA